MKINEKLQKCSTKHDYALCICVHMHYITHFVFVQNSHKFMAIFQSMCFPCCNKAGYSQRTHILVWPSLSPHIVFVAYLFQSHKFSLHFALSISLLPNASFLSSLSNISLLCYAFFPIHFVLSSPRAIVMYITRTHTPFEHIFTLVNIVVE